MNLQKKSLLILQLNIALSVFIACSHSSQNSDDPDTVKVESNVIEPATDAVPVASEDLGPAPVPEPLDASTPAAEPEPAAAHHSRRRNHAPAAEAKPTEHAPVLTDESIAAAAAAKDSTDPIAQKPAEPDPMPTVPPQSSLAPIPAAAAGEINEDDHKSIPSIPYVLVAGLVAIVLFVLVRRRKT
jgi:hypothetical protein